MYKGMFRVDCSHVRYFQSHCLVFVSENKTEKERNREVEQKKDGSGCMWRAWRGSEDPLGREMSCGSCGLREVGNPAAQAGETGRAWPLAAGRNTGGTGRRTGSDVSERREPGARPPCPEGCVLQG